jgi:hypothetical protein
LGTKPSTPPAAALLALMLVARARQTGDWRGAGLGVVLAGALGLEAYAINVLRYGNPVWPALVDFGPIHLPGTISMQELLSSGAGAPKVYGSLPERVLKSWTALYPLPAFDMRVGGLSILFWATLPLALYRIVTRKLFAVALLLLIAVVTPDPAIARYVLPVPGLVFAAALPVVTDLPLALRAAAHIVLAVVGASNLVYAAPALAGEGPPLLDYSRMPWAERERAVGANGTPRAFVDARERLARGETAVYDRSLWLPYLMWRSDLANRVVRVPDTATTEQARELLRGPGVRLIAAGAGAALDRATANDRARYELLFRCKEPCVVYWQR